MNDFPPQSLVAIVGSIIAASLLLWVLAAERLVRGEPLVTLTERAAVPWTFSRLLVIGLVGVVVLALSQSIGMMFLELPVSGWQLETLPPRQMVGVLLTFSISSLISWATTMLVARRWVRASWSSLGFSGWSTVGRDLALGAAAYAMLIVPVLGMHFVAQWAFPTDETHPFVELIMKSPRAEYLIPIAFAALITAPITEEYVFRVFLQGWLERLMAGWEYRWRPPVTIEVASSTQSEEAVVADGDDVLAAATDDPPATVSNMLAPSIVPALPGLPQQAGWRCSAIAISSAMFALAHFGQGPAPISLFVLALGLGYLYQRTHRVLPGMFVHFLVNLTAVVQLAVQIATR